MGEHLGHFEAEAPFGCPRRTPVRDLGLGGGWEGNAWAGMEDFWNLG